MNAVRLWVSEEARSRVREQDPGGLIRLGRTGLGWRLEDLGSLIGCSAATVSRLERRGRKSDFDLIMSAAKAVGIPTHVLAASLGLTANPPTIVAPDGPRRAEEDDPMRRRTLLTATGLAVPASLMAGVSDALASVPDPTGSPVPLDSRLAAARALFDAGQNSRLLCVLPGLLADANHAASPVHEEVALARLSTAYSLASSVLRKVGNYGDSRLAADRATLYAEWSGSPLAAVAAARELSIVLRHQDQPAAAQRHILDAVAKVEETGLRTDAQRSAYAQMLCTTSYTAARAGQRDQALTMIRDAAYAHKPCPRSPPRGACSLSPRPPSTCTPSAFTGPSETRAPRSKLAATSARNSSQPPSARAGCTPTLGGHGGSGARRSKRLPSCCRRRVSPRARSATGPRSGRS